MFMQRELNLVHFQMVFFKMLHLKLQLEQLGQHLLIFSKLKQFKGKIALHQLQLHHIIISVSIIY
jgi:hypothetical protein